MEFYNNILVAYLIINAILIILGVILNSIRIKKEKKETEIRYKRIAERVGEVESKDGIQGLINVTKKVGVDDMERRIAISLLKKAHVAHTCLHCNGTGFVEYSTTNDSNPSDTFNHPLWGEAEIGGFNFAKEKPKEEKCKECNGIGVIIKS